MSKNGVDTAKYAHSTETLSPGGDFHSDGIPLTILSHLPTPFVEELSVLSLYSTIFWISHPPRGTPRGLVFLMHLSADRQLPARTAQQSSCSPRDARELSGRLFTFAYFAFLVQAFSTNYAGSMFFMAISSIAINATYRQIREKSNHETISRHIHDGLAH